MSSRDRSTSWSSRQGSGRIETGRARQRREWLRQSLGQGRYFLQLSALSRRAERFRTSREQSAEMSPDINATCTMRLSQRNYSYSTIQVLAKLYLAHATEMECSELLRNSEARGFGPTDHSRYLDIYLGRYQVGRGVGTEVPRWFLRANEGSLIRSTHVSRPQFLTTITSPSQL